MLNKFNHKRLNIKGINSESAVKLKLKQIIVKLIIQKQLITNPLLAINQLPADFHFMPANSTPKVLADTPALPPCGVSKALFLHIIATE